MKKSIRGDWKKEGGYTFHPQMRHHSEVDPKEMMGLDPGEYDHYFEVEVKHNGKSIGHVNAFGNRVDEKYGKVYIGDAALDREHRGKGVGQAMYEHLYQHAAKHGYNKVISSGASDDARRVHDSISRKHGVKDEGPSSYTQMYDNPFKKADLASLLTKGTARKLAAVPDPGSSEELVHYSPRAGLKQLDPNKMGTSGVGGLQYKRGVPENKSTFFYTKDSAPEDLVTGRAQSRYTVKLGPHHKVYDLGLDPEHLVREAKDRNQQAFNEDILHSVIKEKGYHGVKWKMADNTHVVQMYHPTEVHSEEPIVPGTPTKMAASEGYKTDMAELLTKGFIRNAALAGLIATAPVATSFNQQAQAQTKPAVKQDAFKHKMLRTIAAVESTGGANTAHAQLPKNSIHAGTKAFGKYGLTPVAIQETARLDKDLAAKHPKLRNMQLKDINGYMGKNPGLEDVVAKSHLNRLRGHFGDDPAKIGHAWLNGITGTKKALRAGQKLKEHWHVKKILEAFHEGQPQQPVKQSLAQMKTGGKP